MNFRVVFAIVVAVLFFSCRKEKLNDEAASVDTPGEFYITGKLDGNSITYREGVSSREVIDHASYSDEGGGEYLIVNKCAIYNSSNPYPYFQIWLERKLTSTADASSMNSNIEVGVDTLQKWSSKGAFWNFHYVSANGGVFYPSSTESTINITEVLDLGNQTIKSSVDGINNTTRRVIQVSGNIPPCVLTNSSNTTSLDTAHFTIRFVSNQTF